MILEFEEELYPVQICWHKTPQMYDMNVQTTNVERAKTTLITSGRCGNKCSY